MVLEKLINKKCLWKRAADEDRNKKTNKALEENSECHICAGYRLNTCPNYLPMDIRLYQ